MKKENIRNEEFDKFLNYIKIIHEYEENVESFSKSPNEIKEEGYLIYKDDYDELKDLLNYNNYKKYLNYDKKGNKPYFNINKFNQIKLLEPIKIKSIDYIKNIIINIGCILVTREIFELVSNKKEKPFAFTANKSKITLSIKYNETLEIDHKNFILDNNSFDKNSPNYNEIMEIFESINKYSSFENSITNNLIDNRQKYGLLLRKAWIDEWKNYSNYENIKNKYFNEINPKINSKQKNIIIKEIIDFREENKFKYKYLSATKAIEVKDELELKNILKNEKLILVNSDFKNYFPYLKNGFLNTKFQYLNGKMNLIFDKNSTLSFNSNDNIFSLDKICEETDDLNIDLNQLIKIFCFQHSFPDIETKEYNDGKIQRNKIILINKNKIQKYKDNFNYKVLSENLKEIIQNKKELINDRNIIDYNKLSDSIIDNIISELSSKYRYNIEQYNNVLPDDTSQNFEIKNLENFQYIDSFELINQDIADFFIKQKICNKSDMIEGEVVLDNIYLALFFNYNGKNNYEIGYLNQSKDFIIKYIIKESIPRYKTDIINLLSKGIQKFLELKYNHKDSIWINGNKSAGNFYYIDPKEDSFSKEQNINTEEDFVNNIINLIQNIYLFNLDIEENIKQKNSKRKIFENIYFINKECLSQLKKLIYYKEISRIIAQSKNNKLNQNDSIANLIKSEQRGFYYNKILKNEKEIIKFLENNAYKEINYKDIQLNGENFFYPINFELLNKEAHLYLLKISGIENYEDELSFLINKEKLYLMIKKAGNYNLDKFIFGFELNIENEQDINYEIKNILIYKSLLHRNNDFERILNGKEINELEPESKIYGYSNNEIGKSYVIDNNNINNDVSSSQIDKNENPNKIYSKKIISKAFNSQNISKELKQLIILLLSQENNDEEYWKELKSPEEVYLLNRKYYEQFNNENITNLYNKIWDIYKQLKGKGSLNDIISKLDNSIIEKLENEIKFMKNKIGLNADSKNMKVNSKSIKIYDEFVLINKNNLLYYDNNFKLNFNNKFYSYAKLKDADIIIIKEYSQHSILIGNYIDQNYSFNIKYICDYLSEEILLKEINYIFSIKNIKEYIKNSILFGDYDDYISPIFDEKDIVGTCYKYNGLKFDYTSNIDYLKMLNNEKLISSIVLSYNYQTINNYIGNLRDLKEENFLFYKFSFNESNKRRMQL